MCYNLGHYIENNEVSFIIRFNFHAQVDKLLNTPPTVVTVVKLFSGISSKHTKLQEVQLYKQYI